MRIKTAIIEGTALDWAVAHIEGWTVLSDGIQPLLERGPRMVTLRDHSHSTNAGLAGPIIEREKIGPVWSELWSQWTVPHPKNAALELLGPTHLVAAMRWYVTSRLGDEVTIPDLLASYLQRLQPKAEEATGEAPRG